MHEALINRLGGLSLPRKSVFGLTDHPDMTLDVYRGRKNNNTTTTIIAFDRAWAFIRINTLFCLLVLKLYSIMCFQSVTSIIDQQ